MLLAVGCCLAPAHAWAQESTGQPELPEDAGAEVQDSIDADVLKGIDVSKLDWSQLDIDASTLSDVSGSHRRSSSKPSTEPELTWSSKARPDGSSAVAVKQSLLPFWDTRIGADMTVAREPTTMSELLSEKMANGGSLPKSTGSAWASMAGPGAGPLWDQTAVEARVDPAEEQSKLGTSLSKSLPLDARYSLTLRDGFNMIQQGIVPVPGIVSRPTRSYETEQSAKLSILDSGTSFVAGQSLSTNADKRLHSFGAEQKLFEGASISGSIGETAQGLTNKSVKAGFTKSW